MTQILTGKGEVGTHPSEEGVEPKEKRLRNGTLAATPEAAHAVSFSRNRTAQK